MGDPAPSPTKRKKKNVEIVGIAYLYSMGDFSKLGSQISVLILGIRSIFSY